MRRLLIFVAIAGVLGIAWSPPAAGQVLQTPIKVGKIPQFVDPLPLLGPTGLPVVMGNGNPQFISICEFQTQILPAGALGKNTPAPWTWVWGYHVGQTCPQPDPVTGIVDGGHSYIGPVVVADRGTPTQLTFINQLGDTFGSNVIAYTQNTDQTMHWADPLSHEDNLCAEQLATWEFNGLPQADCALNYAGPIAAAVHLHGGEVPPDLDGGPDSWFTFDGAYRGHGYYTREVSSLPSLPDPDFPAGVLVRNLADGIYYRSEGTTWTDNAELDRVTYVYPNTQEAANIWFHDHVLGFTRLNVYAGIAGAYVIRDAAETNPALGPVTNLIPLVLQDRMFDTTGQLYYAAGGTTPEHPYWIPEFIGNIIVVNGKAWPYLNVEPKKYRFLFLNGSNARAYEVLLKDKVTGTMGPPMWVIGTDGGYLDSPAMIDPNAMPPQELVVMPGERYEVLIDFSAFAGATLRMENSAGTPFPFGEKVDGSTTKRVMEFRVAATATATPSDVTFDPMTMSPRVTPIVPLFGITADVRRQLTLNEIGSPLTGTPLEALLNNTKWSGMQVIENVPPPHTLQERSDFVQAAAYIDPIYFSELPSEGDIESWEIINITADAHPIHLHLTQFQLLERQPIDPVCYNAIYNASFPGGLFRPGYGPPADYNTGQNELGQISTPGVLGGNPDPSPCFVGMPLPPGAHEAGWKDTVIAYPDQVTKIMVRWAPTDEEASTTTENLAYPFDPNHGHGYVWHCHILDHEDNEMMRPTQVNTNTLFTGTRTFVKGSDY